MNHIQNLCLAAICGAGLLSAASAMASGASATIPASSAQASSAPVSAAQTAADEQQKIKDFMATLHPVHGDIKLAEGDAELHLGTAYYFLDKADAAKVITQAWGNPPGNAENILGMVVPEGSNPIENWGAMVTYEKTDYISDKDADKTDYNKLVKQIQDGEADENAQRKKDGYPEMHLVGWAQAPTYDKTSHTMIWARDFKLSNTQTDTLNYDVRLLGRRGVLSLNMVDFMPNLPSVREQAKQLALAGVFATGARYQDYQAGKDPKAAYGVAGLVAAGLGVVIAKKFGLLAIALLVLKKGYILLLAGMAAVRAFWAKLFGKKPPVATLPVTTAEPAGEGPYETAEALDVPAQPVSPTVEDASPHRPKDV